jgi:two-component system, NarL family, sensor histidine kinase UhpB
VLASINWLQVSKLITVILAVQLLYWFAIDKPLFRADPGKAPKPVEMLSADIARLQNPTFAAAAAATYKPIQLTPPGVMWTHCCDTAMFAVRIRFQIDTIPANGLGLISNLQVDNYALAVNDSTLVARGRMQPGNSSFHGQSTFLTRIPAGLLKVGSNELVYITVRDGFPYTDILAPRMADYDALEQHSKRRLFIVGDFILLSGVLLGLLGLLATIMIFRSDDWRFAMWLCALCLGFTSYSIYTLWLDPPLDGWGRMLAFFACYLFIPTALLCFIDCWTQHPIRWVSWGAFIGYGGTLAVIAWYIYRVPMPAGFDIPTTMWIWFLLASAVAVVVRLLWHFITQKEERLLESALLTVFAIALVMDALSNQFPNLGIREGNLLNSSSFLIVAMMAAFLARNFRLFQSQTALTTLLQNTVTLREAELIDAAQREQVLIRQQAHDEERRRIMRDLHDGVGGQLMSMMLSARVGSIEQKQVAEGLQTAIDELRLMVDSMDSVGESLVVALATFQARLKPRVEAAGFVFEWQQHGDFNQSAHTPRDVLQIFRILQEAVTNALKHSGGSIIAVDVQSDVGAVIIAVCDDGDGFNNTSSVGRGLRNMDMRAAALGGTLEVQGAVPGKGTCVRLTLPGAVVGSLATI